MWQPYLCKTTSGQLVEPIYIPKFSWDLTISDFSLTTDTDKDVAKEDVSGLTIPWGAVPGDDPSSRSSALSPLRRSICLFWVTDQDINDTNMGTPVMFGVIKPRTDTRLDTSFDVMGMASFLDYRQCVRENKFGTSTGGTSKDVISYNNLSYRGIVSNLGVIATSSKPGGSLPIDWQYTNEKGTRQRNYNAYDVQNISMADVMTKIANVENGPDMTFRPYLSGNTVRIKFMAGSDSDIYLEQKTMHTFQSFDGGGNMDNLEIDHAWPIMRYYTTGAGSDDSTLCYLAEDKTLVQLSDPWPLVEATYSDTDTSNYTVLKQHGNAKLAYRKRPIMQISGKINFSDKGTPGPGEIWPGELVQLSIQDFQTLPDGVYSCRLMEMSGDQTDVATLTFDIMENPIY